MFQILLGIEALMETKTPRGRKPKSNRATVIPIPKESPDIEKLGMALIEIAKNINAKEHFMNQLKLQAKEDDMT